MSYLKEVKDDVILDILKNGDRIDKNRNMVKGYKGNLDYLYEEGIRTVSVPQHRMDLDTHKTHVNPFQKAINKLSNNYSFNVDREFEVNSGKSVLDYYDNKKIAKAFLEINRYANVSQYALLKIKYDKKKGNFKYIPLSSDQFWLYTNDEYNPNEPKVYVEFIKDLMCKDLEKKSIVWAKSFYLYTDEERLEVNAYKSRSGELKVENVNENTENPLGFAPFVLLSYDNSQLIPELNSSDYSFAQRIPILYTNIVIAMHYLSNPLAVFKNIDIKKSKLAIDPSSAIVLNKPQGQEGEPGLDFISPNLDISQGLNLIADIISQWYYSKDVPVKKEGVVDMSGLAMLIEGADTLEARKNQMPYLSNFEEDFWNKLAKFHNYILQSEMKDTYKGPKELVDEEFEVNVEYTLPSTASEQVKESGDSEEVNTEELNSIGE